MVIMFIGEEVEFNSVMKLLSYRSGGGNKGAKKRPLFPSDTALENNNNGCILKW